MKIGFGLMSSGVVEHEYVECLLGMFKSATYDYQIFSAKSCLVPKNRRVIAEAFMESDCSHLLFLDTDMVFPPDIVERLLEMRVPVAAANCVTRKFPVRFTADLPTTRGSGGIERVWRVGTAVMLVERSVFEKIGKPWFGLGWDPRTGSELGEDYMFCQHCGDVGIPIYISHDLSKDVYHVGKYAYGIKDYRDE